MNNMQPNDTAIRKRTQITKANRTMFVWVAIVSVIVGFSVVGSIFLVQKLFFNEKVIKAKETTVQTLKENNANITELQAQVRVLDSNEALASVKSNPEDQAIQVILDALPSDANSLALGASLQNKLLAGIDGLTIQTLQVDPVVGVEQLAADGESEPVVVEEGDDTSVSANQISLRFSVSSASPDALKTVLQRLERSIRTIKVLNIKIENQGEEQLLTIEARAFYEPARVVELKESVVKP